MLSKIVIDPGHGGKDPGAVGFGLRECDLTLRIGTLLHDKLKARGFDTLLTRSKDEYISPLDRAIIANKYNAELFISIHINAAPSVQATGIETLVYTNSVLGNIVQRNLVRDLKLIDRGVKVRTDLAVLNSTKMPAILTETGFITNESDAKKLKNDKFLNTIAESIYRSICENYGIDPSSATQPSENNPHWAQKHLDALIAKGIITSPQAHKDLDAYITKGEIFALINKLGGDK